MINNPRIEGMKSVMDKLNPVLAKAHALPANHNIEERLVKLGQAILGTIDQIVEREKANFLSDNLVIVDEIEGHVDKNEFDKAKELLETLDKRMDIYDMIFKD